MKNILSAMRSTITRKTWIATISNDCGESIQQTIRAHSYRAAQREAFSLTDSDWYTVTVQPVANV